MCHDRFFTKGLAFIYTYIWNSYCHTSLTTHVETIGQFLDTYYFLLYVFSGFLNMFEIVNKKFKQNSDI